MSVIGTTLKQPRVFAHDAVALKDLPGCQWRFIKDMITDNAGTGFQVGDIVEGYIKNPGNTLGNGVTIQVDAVDPGGEITEYIIINCGGGTAYNLGDVINFTPPAGGDDAIFTVDGISFQEWDYGCPFTTMNMALSQDPLYATDANDLPDVGNPLPTYLQKTKYTYTCACEEGPCSCTYETPGPGASLYIGYDLQSLTLIMETERKVTWSNIPAGSFMPVSALTVCEAIAAGPVGDVPDAEALKSLILALF